MIDFKQYKSILCLNGDLPEATFFHGELPIIAADGSANTLMKMGIMPQLVIGDLDSIMPKYAKQLKLLFRYDQNYCDFQKSLDYLQEQHLLPAIIVGVNGGYLDHILNNVNLFLNSKSVLYAPPLYGYTLSANTHHTFQLPFNTKISLIGIPTADVTTQGLRWELHHYILSFPGNNSCFNRSLMEDIVITVHQGDVLVLIYGEGASFQY